MCRDTVAEGRLGGQQSGGECHPQPYLEFTHTCTVTNYLPSVDHCCCALKGPGGVLETWGALQQPGGALQPARGALRPRGDLQPGGTFQPVGGALCCRYHQTWNRYRCEAETDSIDLVYVAPIQSVKQFQNISTVR